MSLTIAQILGSQTNLQSGSLNKQSLGGDFPVGSNFASLLGNLDTVLDGSAVLPGSSLEGLKSLINQNPGNRPALDSILNGSLGSLGDENTDLISDLSAFIDLPAEVQDVLQTRIAQQLPLDDKGDFLSNLLESQGIDATELGLLETAPGQELKQQIISALQNLASTNQNLASTNEAVGNSLIDEGSINQDILKLAKNAASNDQLNELITGERSSVQQLISQLKSLSAGEGEAGFNTTKDQVAVNSEIKSQIKAEGPSQPSVNLATDSEIPEPVSIVRNSGQTESIQNDVEQLIPTNKPSKGQANLANQIQAQTPTLNAQTVSNDTGSTKGVEDKSQITSNSLNQTRSGSELPQAEPIAVDADVSTDARPSLQVADSDLPIQDVQRRPNQANTPIPTPDPKIASVNQNAVRNLGKQQAQPKSETGIQLPIIENKASTKSTRDAIQSNQLSPGTELGSNKAETNRQTGTGGLERALQAEGLVSANSSGKNSAVAPKTSTPEPQLASLNSQPTGDEAITTKPGTLFGTEEEGLAKAPTNSPNVIAKNNGSTNTGNGAPTGVVDPQVGKSANPLNSSASSQNQVLQPQNALPTTQATQSFLLSLQGEGELIGTEDAEIDSLKQATTGLEAQSGTTRASNAANLFRANASVPIGSVAAEIVAQANAGKNRFEIRLDPPELGRIDVKLDVAKDGSVSTRLVVERPETLDLLQRDARALEKALNESGLKTDSNGLQFSLKGDQGGGSDNRSLFEDRIADAATLSRDEEDTEEVTPVALYQSLTVRDGIDIRI